VSTEWIEFHHEAGLEFDAVFEWYIERSPDAAIRFDAEVDRALAQIIAAPKRWAVGSHATRRFLLRQFPYILVYRERPSPGDIQIVAVAHTSRRPGYGKKRL
jgi:plasmid stabilization system protein ParE